MPMQLLEICCKITNWTINRDLLHEEDYRLLKIDEPTMRQYMRMESEF